MNTSDIQSRAVIMCGISGSGKTYHALQFAKQGYERLSVDALVWKKAGEGLDQLSSEEQKKLFQECRDRVQAQLIELLKSGKKVVVDATHCKRSVRDNIRRACAETGVKPIFAFCIADEEELWHRLSQRKGMGPDDLIVTREELSRYWRGFERPQSDETDFIYLS